MTTTVPSVPIPTSTTTLTPSAASPSTRFATLFESTREPVRDLLARLQPSQPTAALVEQQRLTICNPAFAAPDRNHVGVQIALLIRSAAQQDPELGRRWLADGILTVYERVDNPDGTFLVNIVWPNEVITRLVETQVSLTDEVAAHRSNYCTP